MKTNKVLIKKVKDWLFGILKALIMPTLVIGVVGYLGKTYLDTKLDRQTERLKVELTREVSNDLDRLERYEILQETLFEVRTAGTELSSLLAHDPSPNFEQDISEATNHLNEAGDNFQNLLGKNSRLPNLF